MGKNSYILFLLISLIQLSFASAESALRIGYADFPPFSTRASTGEPVGEIIEKAKKILAKSNIKNVKWVYLPPKRIYKSLMAGELDAFIGPVASKGLNRFCYISNEIVLSMGISLWSLDPAVQKIKSIEEVKEDSIGLMFGYTYGESLATITELGVNSDKRIEAKTTEDLISALYKKRIKYALNYDDPMNFYVVHTPLKDIYSKKLKTVDTYLIVSKKAENSKEIFDQLQQSLRSLKPDPR